MSKQDGGREWRGGVGWWCCWKACGVEGGGVHMAVCAG